MGTPEIVKMAEKCKLSLPLSRIKTIMKSSPDVAAISQESLFLIAKATEVFVQDLAQMSLKLGEDPKSVEYNTLANIVNDDETMQFLQDIIPPKITVREYYSMMGRKVPGEKEEEKSPQKNAEPEVQEIADDD